MSKQLSNEGTLTNKNSKLNYKLVSEKKGRKFQFQVYKLKKIEEVDNVKKCVYSTKGGITMTLPESNFKKYLWEMGYLK